MKEIMRGVDRFCAKHPRFGVRNLMLYIVIGNIAAYLFSLFFGSNCLNTLYFSAPAILNGQIWRLVTFVLVPTTTRPLFLLISLYFYYFVGNTLERQWGSGKFTVYYASGMLFLIVFGMLVYFLFGRVIMFGADMLDYGMFFAFATFFPELQVLLFYFIPIKVKWLALADLALFVYFIVMTQFPANLLPVVVLLHYLVFCGGWLFDRLRPSHIQQRAKTVQFRQEAARIRREQEKKPYNRKCDVCGRTDVSDPELEFRYCSRCAGYHCYCQDHINSHVHFTE